MEDRPASRNLGIIDVPRYMENFTSGAKKICKQADLPVLRQFQRFAQISLHMVSTSLIVPHCWNSLVFSLNSCHVGSA